MDKFSNHDVCRLVGFNSRQVSYLAEKQIVLPDLEDSSGRGSRRWYSRWNLFELFLVDLLRSSGFDFAFLRPLLRGVRHYFNGRFVGFPLNPPVEQCPHFLLIVDGRYLYFTDEAAGTSQVLDLQADDFRWAPVHTTATSRTHTLVWLHPLLRQAQQA